MKEYAVLSSQSCKNLIWRRVKIVYTRAVSLRFLFSHSRFRLHLAVSIIRKFFSKSIKLACLLLILACMAAVWYGWYESTPILRPHTINKTEVTNKSGLSMDAFEFTGTDGLPVNACIVTGNTKGELSPRQSRVRDLVRQRGRLQNADSHEGVVLVATSWDNGIENSLAYAEVLAGMGYTCVVWDPWGKDACREFCSYGYREAGDIPLLIDAVENKLGKKGDIMAIGKGFGASMMMLSTPKDARIRSLVCIDAFCILRTPVMNLLKEEMNKPMAYASFWAIDMAMKIRAGYSCFDVVPVDAARQIDVPCMLVCTEEYPLAALDDSVTIYAAMNTPEDKRTVYAKLAEGEQYGTKTREHVILHELTNGEVKEQRFMVNIYDGTDDLMAVILEWLPGNTMAPLPKILPARSASHAVAN